jgi:hypothetical protein
MASVDSTWPPPSGLATPTTPRASAVLTLAASTRISAPAATVFAIVCDTAKYPEWNTFIPKVTILSQPEGTDAESKVLELNTKFVFHAVMDLKKPGKDTPTQLRITDFSTPEKPYNEYLGDLIKDESFTEDTSIVYRIAWKGEGSYLVMGLQTERFHEVIIRGEEECEVRTWEVMSGPVAYTVKWMFKANLQSKFELWVEDLKKRAEGVHKDGAGS